MVYGEVYILDRVKNARYGRIDIFEKHIDTHVGATIFMTIREEIPDKAVQAMQRFCKDSSGDFTVFMRARHNQHWSTAEVVHIHISRALELSPGQTFGSGDIESLVNARLSEIMNERDRLSELENLRAENNRLKNPMDRITYVLEAVISRFMPEEEPAVNGLVNGTENIDLDTLNKAVAGLMQKFSAQGLIDLNAYLEKNPNAINLVKQYAGI